MHIAICDDTIADRKQLERLLKRESDRRAKTTGVLYIDAYGDLPSLLKSPMLYDTFFIDMCKGAVTGMDVVNALTQVGVQAPLILCSSLISYREQSFDGAPGLLYLDKPIRTSELSDMLDHTICLAQDTVSLIELREESGTLYVTEPDIMYAVKDGRRLRIMLTDGRTATILSSTDNFYDQLDHYPSFFSPTSKTVLNGRHIEKLTLFNAYMTDGTKMSIPPGYMAYAKYAFQTFHNQDT